MLPTLILSVLPAHVELAQEIVTRTGELPLVSRTAPPLTLVIAPPEAATRNVEDPVAAETTLPRLGEEAVID
jgi:hypothetical protein